MEIRVKGTGIKKFTPDQIILQLTFNYTGTEYNTTLAEGVKSVRNFVESVLGQHNFSTEDLKTNSFIVRENKVFNESTRTWENRGFIFTQDATLSFDYDKNKLVTLMSEISQLNHAPIYRIIFSIKDQKSAHHETLALAYQDAETQAKAIADAAGKQLQQCIRTDFQSSMPSFNSESGFHAKMAQMGDAETASMKEDIAMAFTPEDVIINEILYCLWDAN